MFYDSSPQEPGIVRGGGVPVTTDPLFDFLGRTVLVTGGSRGLGREMALASTQPVARVPSSRKRAFSLSMICGTISSTACWTQAIVSWMICGIT